MSKQELEFEIKTEGHLPKLLNIQRGDSEIVNQQGKRQKKTRRHQSLAYNSIVRDRRVSSLLKNNKRKSEKHSLQQKKFSFQQEKDLEKTSNNNKTGKPLRKAGKNNTIKQEEAQCQQQVKVIKKALKVLPLSFRGEQFILIVYVTSKVICTRDSIQTLSFHYDSTLLSVQSPQLLEVNLSQHMAKHDNQALTSSQTKRFCDEFMGDVTNVFQLVNQLGDIVANKGVILVWQKSEPVIHEIAFRVDYRTSQMLDLSDPENIRSQKNIFSSVNYVLEYRNKITLHLNSNLIKEIIISPNCQNFLILTGRNHTNTEYRDSEFENIDVRPDEIEERYDVDDYLIFQYDLFAQLWSSDANVYLKNIPLCYHKRKVEQIVPFPMKNQVLALTGKKVHQLNKSLLDGILNFDLHPYGYFIAVSFGFNVKIYSLEHSSLNLIYTYNSQNIKKIKYSPNGANFVVMSQKTIKILDSYSFSIKYVLQQKNPQSSFTTFAYSFTGHDFYTVCDNVFINVYESQSYLRTNSIRPGQSSLLGLHDKIVTIIPDSEGKFCLGLLQNGKIYFRWDDDVVVIQHERMYAYEDGRRITCVHYDAKRRVLFCGLQNGMVRAHIWPIRNQTSYNFNIFSEFKFGYGQITVLTTSFLTPKLYIGDQNGNLTTCKFIIEKEKKITGEIRPNDYYILSSHSPLNEMKKSQLQLMSEKYVLASNSTSMMECPEKLKLQYKLNEIIMRMNQQMKSFKKDVREKLVEKEAMAKNKLNFNKLYNQSKSRLTKTTHQLKYIKEKETEEKNILNSQFEQRMKRVIDEQNELIKEKGLQLSKNMMAKFFLKQIHLNEHTVLKQQQTKMQNEYSINGMKGIQLMIREEELVPYDQIDYLPNDKIEVKREVVQKLNYELKKQQERNYQLKKAYTYMENTKNNLQMGSIKQETKIFNISQQLKSMQDKLSQQINLKTKVAQQLQEADHKIKKTQEQVLHRNPQFSKVINGSADDEGCTYKLWVKDRMLEEVDLLHNHFNNLIEIMEQKQVDIIDLVTYKKKISESLSSTKLKKENMKKYLNQLKDHSISLSNKLNQYKFECIKYEGLNQKTKQKEEKEKQLKKIKQKEKSYQETKPLSIALLDLMVNKINKNKQKQKRCINKLASKNQQFSVEQQFQGHQILLQKSNSKIFQHKFIRQPRQKTETNKYEAQVQTSQQIKQKAGKLIEQIDQKVKNQWRTLENDKYNIKTPLKSSSQKCLTRRLKKLKSQTKTTDISSSFSVRLFERFKEKEKKEQLTNNDSNKKQNTRNERVIPFSAISSPALKHISSQFNLYQKSSKFIKNNVKIQQRKVKRLNGQKVQLLGEFEQLRYENKGLEDNKTLFHDRIQFLTDQIDKSLDKSSSAVRKQGQGVKIVLKTPFQKYVQQRSCKISPHKTMTQFKQNLSTRQKGLISSRSSRQKLNLPYTAFNTPRHSNSPTNIKKKASFLKKI